jgi:hemolysin III
MSQLPRYSKGEEIANSVTHGIGVIVSIAGLVLLIVFSALYGNAWHVVSSSIYGASLLILYLSSTLYHSLQGQRAKSFFRILDHSSIFILIAGTYTPFTLVSLRGPWGWTIFGLIWGLTLAGIFFKVFFINRFSVLSTVIYVLMGWMIVIAIKPVIEAVPPGGLILLVSGGLCYTIGLIFYAWKNLKYGHMIWHLFVIGGSVLHYFAVMFYVIPPID